MLKPKDNTCFFVNHSYSPSGVTLVPDLPHLIGLETNLGDVMCQVDSASKGSTIEIAGFVKFSVAISY